MCWQGCRQKRIILEHYWWEYELVQWLLKIVSVQFSHSGMSNSLQPHGLQHTRPPCPSPTPRVYSNSWPLSRWCHPTISSSVVLFSSCLQSFPASGSLPGSQFFTSGGQVLENNVEVSQKIKNRTAIWPSNFTPGFIYKGNEIIISKWHLYPHDLCSIIYNSQHKKQSKSPLDKENVVYTFTVEYYSDIRKGNPAICYNMKGPWGHYAKWNKSDRERQILHDFTYLWNLEKKKQLIETENRLVVSKSQVGEVQGEGIIYYLLMMVSIPTFLF